MSSSGRRLPALTTTRRSLSAAALVALSVALCAQVTVGTATAAPSGAPASGSAAGASKGRPPAATARPAVIGTRIIGYTVRGRPIRAFHLGQPAARKTVVAIGAMHGSEQRTDDPLYQLRDHQPITGVDLWVVPVMNPDGYRRDDRQNAHGVDLNRNFPVRWVDLDGDVESGPRPASEPETRAMMRFLTRIDPDHMVSLHQPLYGVDPHTKNPIFARRLAREMRLPIRTVTCGGTCHGTMTQWFNRRHDGDSITAELAAYPSEHYLRAVAPNGLLRTVGGAR